MHILKYTIQMLFSSVGLKLMRKDSLGYDKRTQLKGIFLNLNVFDSPINQIFESIDYLDIEWIDFKSKIGQDLFVLIMLDLKTDGFFC
jgi:hypothetical protein